MLLLPQAVANSSISCVAEDLSARAACSLHVVSWFSPCVAPCLTVLAQLSGSVHKVAGQTMEHLLH